VRLREVFRFELHYRLRQPSTWVYALVLLGMPFLMTHAVDGGDVHINAPEIVAIVSATLGILGTLVTAGLFSDAALRDVQTGMHPLFYTTPLRRMDYLGGRFLGALLVNAVLVAAIPLGLLLGTLMPYLPAEMFGPFRAGTYLQPYVLLLLPNLALCSAILFAVAVLTRQALATYMGGVALFVGYLFAGRITDGLQNRTLAALLDPFAISTIEDIRRYATVVEQNTELVGFPGILLWNRLLWLAVAVVVLLLLYRRFRFEQAPREREAWWRRRRTADDRGREAAARTAPRAPSALPAAREFGARTALRQLRAVTGHALGQVLSNRAILGMVAVVLGTALVFGWRVGEAVFGTTTWPVTHLVAGRALTVPMEVFVPVLLTLIAGELVWRERDTGVHEIVATEPVPDWVPFAGRFLALAVLLVGMQLLLMPLGVAIQAMQGYHEFELGLYVRILFGMALPQYLLLAALALAVHTILDHKHLGHLVVVLYYVFTLNAGKFGIEHNLWLYASDPGWTYSDLNGFGPFLGPFFWFKAYWAAWALLLAVAANVFMVRGVERGARLRLALARSRLTGRVAGAAALAVALVVALGGFILYNTNVLNDYRSDFETDALRAAYERRYARFTVSPQPQITRAELRIELHPDEGAAELRGSYHLVNDTGEPIDSVHVLTRRELRTRSLTFDRPARLALQDEELQYRIFALHRSLLPGDSLRLTFDLEFRPRGFPNHDIPTTVARNGAYFERGWLPIIGYQQTLELAGARARQEHGLPPRDRMPPMDDPVALRESSDLRDADLVHVDAIIGTAPGQVAVTTGRLVREWRAGDRRYFHYRTDRPIPFGAPVLSAEYAVREDRWRDVRLQVFHHPTHTFNLERMVASMKASLDYYTTHFGPYPHDQLRVVEFPRYASFARAHPHTITFSEGGAFLTRVEEGDVDRPFFVIAHETAHQWWGGGIAPARVRGAAFLSESLAQYSAMMVMETAYGPGQVRKFYDYEMDRYLTGRRAFSSREVPLLEVETQSFLYYHKGAVALYTLREHLGADRLNTALRRFHDRYSAGGPPYATARDLYREILTETPDSLRPLLHDLFETVTLWEVRTLEARAEPLAGGHYRVTLEVEARKVRTDSLGNETEVPMDDLVEVGIFVPAPAAGPGEALYLRRHRIGSGRQSITVIVPGQPSRAGLDPYRKLIQRDRRGNTVRVQGGLSDDGGVERSGPSGL
jgi:ABC-2 type transport system permease protein